MIPPNQIKISLITAPEFNLEYLWWLTILFFVLAVIYFVGVFFIRNKITSKNNRTKDKKVEFSPMINEFLFYEDSNTKEEKMNYLNLKVEIRELIKNNFDRDVLTEILLDLRKDLSGNSQAVLIKLYKDLGLHHDAYAKLRSSKWQVVSSGILELTTMEVEDSYGLIIKFINHRQSTIRKQAEIAVVNLKEEGIKYFLDNTKYKIAEWQQLKLLDVLRHKPNYTPPQFGLWLTSSNTHVVLFSLRLIKYYSQNEAEKSIITLLKHKKRDIQAEAIECIKDFHFVNALQTLKLVYPKASHDIKIAILDAIGELGTTDEVSFLENLQLTERNFNIKGKVIGTLNRIDPERILPTKNIATLDFFDVKLDDLTQEAEKEEVNVLEEIPLHEVINEISTEIEIDIDTEVIANVHEMLSTDQDKILIDQVEDIIKEELIVEITPEDEFEKEEEEEVLLVENELEADLQSTEIEKVNSINDIDLSFLLNINNDEIIEENAEETITEISDKNEPMAEIANEEQMEKDLTFHFLPMVVDKNLVQEENLAFEQEDFESLFILNDAAVQEEQIEKSVLNTDHVTKMTINEIDWSFINENEDEQNEVVIKDADKEEAIISFENDDVSFSPNFMRKKDLDDMVLLENISELGDCRELILLYQIIEENNSDIVIDRANELIQKFSYQSPRPNDLFSNDNNLSTSVFTEVYHKADKETRHLLLDEIMMVGGEKEILLLESVLETESKSLFEKATVVLKHLKSQIPSNIESAVSLLEEDSIFNLHFELDSKKPAQQRGSDSDENRLTLFDQLCSMSNSLYNKLNG
ncbi:hypothetical protein [Maribacter sp.]|uniref:HEAT repeat domain-containing protein n=1 Tax=Maribacter sp. TaxID=1897614 RepID=UPI0032971001